MIKNNFYTFYDINRVAPVRIDHKKISNHFKARKNLYRELSLYDELIRNKEIIEFGPGSGENSLFNLNLNPKKYTLVDNSIACIKTCKKFLKKSPNYKKLLFKRSKFENFKSKKKYDFVFAENCIPNNINPKKIYRILTNNVKKGGYFFTTTTSPVGYFSEICRKIISHLYLDDDLTFVEKKNFLLKFFDKDLKNLKYLTRKKEDWIIDNLLQDSGDREMFGLNELLNQKKKFNMMNTYPKFYQNWNWYKDNQSLSITNFKSSIETSYFKNTMNFLDYNKIYQENSIQFGKNIHDLATQTFEISKIKDSQILEKEFRKNINKFISIIDRKKYSQIYKSLFEVINWLNSRNPNSLNIFRNWWGRGNIHLIIRY